MPCDARVIKIKSAISNLAPHCEDLGQLNNNELMSNGVTLFSSATFLKIGVYMYLATSTDFE